MQRLLSLKNLCSQKLKNIPLFQKFFPQKNTVSWKWKIIIGFGVFLFIVICYLYILLAPFRDFFWRLPSITGFLGERNYLVLIQNNSELRPSGGFITAYGELSFFLGNMNLSFFDSYSINDPQPKIEPPYPLNELLKDDIFYKGFVFRDANWSPDFAQSSEMARSLYLEGQDRVNHIDGVIAVDFTVFEDILKLVGTLDLGDKKFSAKNVFHLMQFYSKNIDLHSEEDLSKRKNVMKDIAPFIIRKLMFSPTLYGDAVALLKKHLDEKHVQFFFENTAWQAIAEKHNWAGRMNVQSGNDYIHVNRANIGGRKADRFIEPVYNYTVSFDEMGQGHAQLDIDYRYIGTQGLYSDFYQSYVRVFLPKEIKDLKSWGDNRTPFTKEEQDSLQSVGALLHLWPGEVQSLHFSYTLNPSITPLSYVLNIHPQPGSFGEHWNVFLRNKNVDNFWSSADFSTRENTAVFSKTLVKDTAISATLEKDETPPVIVWQRFADPNTIEVAFSEKLSDESLVAKNFSLQDKNVKNAVNDEPVVLSVIQGEDYKMYIKLQGISWQFEEQYALKMENIADVSGNMILPNPKEITVVQR